jgi:NAD(P)H-nitrite reductase large subunit
MQRTSYLIIGSSNAALGGIAGIRGADPEGSIILLGAEPEGVYARPLITHWLAGRVGDSQMRPVPGEFWAENRVDARFGTTVARIDTERQEAVTDAGDKIAFGKALIASGGSPIVPPGLRIEGVEGVSTFVSWADARRVRSLIDAGGVRRAVVVGGGFIGIKVAEALTEVGVGVTIVELAERIMSASLDATAAAMARRVLEHAGVTVRCRTCVEAVHAPEGRVVQVALRGGDLLPCDLLVLALGVGPDLRLVEGSDLVVHRGICVDDHLETSVPGIYAAGDVAEATDRLSGTARPIPIVPNARRQGFVAGSNMAGAVTTFQGGVAMNSVGLFDLPCMAIGLAAAEGEELEAIVVHDEARQAYRKLVLRDSRLVGALLLGNIERAGVFAHLIREQIDVTACRTRLLAEDFSLDELPASYWTHAGTPPPDQAEK